MRNPERVDEITNLLNKVWHRYPDLRFWQLMCNIDWAANGMDMFFYEDTKTLKTLQKIDEGGL